MRLIRGGIKRRRRLGTAARCVDAHQVALLKRLEHDHAVAIPGTAGADTRIANHRRGPARHRDALQLIAGEERDLGT